LSLSNEFSPLLDVRHALHQVIAVPQELTDRETDVLKLMTSGISNREIAKALRISEGTVRNHASSIFSKLGVTDRTKAVLYALREGLV
jgi:DNA-binding NarL/FixJ family response regulator